MKSLVAAGALLTTAAGCGDTPDAAPACVPGRAAWDSEVRATVERACGSCHGAASSYGATYSLLDYDFITRPRGASRPVDRVHARLGDGSMPPAGTPAPPFADAQRIASWASCGARPEASPRFSP